MAALWRQKAGNSNSKQDGPFWDHGSDGYATVLCQLHFNSIKKSLLKPVHHTGEASCCSLCVEQVQQKRGS